MFFLLTLPFRILFGLLLLPFALARLREGKSQEYLDRYPDLKPVYFANYTNLLYLAQFANDALVTKAREIAQYLGLPLEVRFVGFGELETRLAELVEAA